MSINGISNFKDLYTKHSFDDSNINLLELWHYTSADGLLGIVGDKQKDPGKLHFWFTRSDCLNDTSEGKHILNLFKEECYKLLKNNSINESFYNAICDIEIPNHKFINFPIPPKEGYTHESVLTCVDCHAYICCFSLKEDSLDMWRYYPKSNGGYGLKLSSMLFEKYKKYEISNYNKEEIFSCIHSYKVIYDEKEKQEKLSNIMIDTYSVFQKDGDIKQAKRFIQYMLKTLQFQFKNNCFSTEQEYRFVYYLPDKKIENLANEMPAVNYREQNGIPIPYIDITIENGNSYLDEVMISPFIKNEEAKSCVSDYLRQCSFNCKTSKSQLPVRY